MISVVAAVSVILSLVCLNNCQTPAPGWTNRDDKVMLMFKYDDEYLVDEDKGGTCNFGPKFGKLGVLMAANTPLYSGNYDYPMIVHNSNGATSGDGCGVCYAVTGEGGTYIAINAEWVFFASRRDNQHWILYFLINQIFFNSICDGCKQFPGQGPSFNLYNRASSQRQIFAEVLGAPADTPRGAVQDPTGITMRKVSCPLSYFGNEGISLRWLIWYVQVRDGSVALASVEWTPVNYRVPSRFLYIYIRCLIVVLAGHVCALGWCVVG
jgi:hypothetical protein